MEIVGLSGYARSGKDEAAKVLVEEFGFIRVAFADKLRDFLYALNPLVRQYWTGSITGESVSHDTRLRDVIDTFGWDGYKETVYVDEVRPLLQRLGTEAGRETLWDSIWIDAAFANLPDDAKVVVTDARFENEAQAIKDRGGSIWRINRTGNKPAVMPDGTIHKSETSLDNWVFDKVLYNDGTLEDFHNVVRSFKNWKPFAGTSHIHRR